MTSTFGMKVLKITFIFLCMLFNEFHAHLETKCKLPTQNSEEPLFPK